MKTYTVEMTLAERVKSKLIELNGNKAEVALQIGLSRTMVSQYLNGNYKSDPTTIENALTKWLEDVEAKGSECNDTLEPVVPAVTSKRLKKVDFFESKDAVGVIGVCNACQKNGSLGIIVGKSGFGKTHSLKQYSLLPRVIYVECNETMNCKDLVRKMERAIGMPKVYGSIDERLEHIINFFNTNMGYLLIVDEADKLITKYTQKKIEILRCIADSARVGIVIAGEPMLESSIKTYDQRLANRLEFYYKLKGLTSEEIERYFKEFEVEEQALEELAMRAINKGNGCFRLLDKTLNNVIRILKENGENKITMKAITEASNMMML